LIEGGATLRAWVTTLWRLGVPSALMVAFALIGLTSAPGQPPDASRPPVRGLAHARQPSVSAAPPLAPPATPAIAPEVDEADGPSVVIFRPAEEPPAEPTLRLPSELEPVAPDVIVALPSPTPWSAVLAHTHVPDGVADDGAWPTPAGLQVVPRMGDDFQGPEPGALYWFGPLGLERIRILGGARG
jgi:hypothetical protein